MKRSRGDATKRIAERLLLGSIMTVMAVIVDRKLRRAFATKK
jgi:hypothetical protein